MCSQKFCKIYKKTPVSQPRNKVAGLRPVTLLKKRLWHRCFPVNFQKFVTFFLRSTSGQLLLNDQCFHRLETSQWIYKANQLSGFYIVGTLVQKEPPEVYYKKAVKYLAIFAGKCLCCNIFLIKLQALRPATLLKRDSIIADVLKRPILKNICEQLLLKVSM